ncbi:MAG: helix-turn-helix transcriptional regulator [Clostridiales bacterium]|nr:helix-turn-helix transcriptional regulator [Clostridiales bacterium]
MNLKSEMRRKYEERNNSLLSRQTELIYYLKLGKKEQCLSILRECSKSYAPDSFLPLLADVADGCDFSAEEYSARFERLGVAGKTRGQWDMLADMADEICGITGTKRTDMDELAALICQYIEENCSDPNMSVTLLTQQFAVSRDLVSKLIRLYKNQTFCDYLLELRMHRAFELLGQTDLSISTIAEAVGYTSYTSFKRAFIRYKGISPREYRVAAESARTR